MPDFLVLFGVLCGAFVIVYALLAGVDALRERRR